MTTAVALSSIFGDRESGQDVRSANMAAVMTVANVLKSSLGPQGLDKMLVSDIGDVTITNDGATILKLLEVNHPAAKVLVELSDLQDQEVGDGTTSVVIIASELLKRGTALVMSQKIHPTSVIGGFKLAMRESVKFLQNNLAVKVSELDKSDLINIARTTLNSKFIGAESNLFAKIVVDSLLSVKYTTENGIVKFPFKAVNVLKTHGQSAKESFLVDGYALDRTTRVSQAMPMSIKNAKIALLAFNLRQQRMHLGVQILVEDPAELDRIRQKERDLCKVKIDKILAAGANVIITSEGIDDMAAKYFVGAGAMAIRRVNKADLHRIAKTTGAKVCITMASLESDEEQFDASQLGHCDEVVEERVGDWDFIMFKGCKSRRAASIVLRGANDFMLDEIERSLHDALCVVSRTLEAPMICAGGGAVEAALSMYLEDFARTLGSREQLAIAEFAEALLVIPKTLAVNAAQDATELVAKLRSAHYEAQRPGSDAGLKFTGLDLINGCIRNNLVAGVVEPVMSKVKSIRFATEAAVTILRIDDVVKLHPEPEPERPR